MSKEQDQFRISSLRSAVLPFLLISFFMVPLKSQCEDNLSDFSGLFDAELAAYKQGDYSMSLACGFYALKVNPDDALARYYVAGSLVKLKRNKEAIQQYHQAAACTHDKQLLNFIKQALSELEPNKATAAASPKSATKKDAKPGSDKSPVMPKELLDAQKQTLLASKAEIEVHRKEADREIAKIHDEEAAQLSSVEQYEWKETETNGRIERVYAQTEAYTSLFEKLKKENEPRISEINARFEAEKKRLESASNLRSQAYSSTYLNEQSQFKMSNGLTQVVPLGSNIYVRNIINYGTDNTPPELKGKMQSLQDLPVPTSGSKPPATNTK